MAAFVPRQLSAFVAGLKRGGFNVSIERSPLTEDTFTVSAKGRRGVEDADTDDLRLDYTATCTLPSDVTVRSCPVRWSADEMALTYVFHVPGGTRTVLVRRTVFTVLLVLLLVASLYTVALTAHAISFDLPPLTLPFWWTPSLRWVVTVFSTLCAYLPLCSQFQA